MHISTAFIKLFMPPCSFLYQSMSSLKRTPPSCWQGQRPPLRFLFHRPSPRKPKRPVAVGACGHASVSSVIQTRSPQLQPVTVACFGDLCFEFLSLCSSLEPFIVVHSLCLDKVTAAAAAWDTGVMKSCKIICAILLFSMYFIALAAGFPLCLSPDRFSCVCVPCPRFGSYARFVPHDFPWGRNA